MKECERRTTLELESALKATITDVEMTVNAKHQRPVRINNLATVDVTTNKENSVRIDTMTGDRRFLVSKATKKYLHQRHKYFYSRCILNI